MGKVQIAKRAKLWNRGKQDYKQVVMGEEVFIPAGGYIECGRRQAINIKGHCCGKHVLVSLEIEPIYETAEENEVWIDHKTGTQFPSREALLKHLGIDPKAAAATKDALRYKCPICDESYTDKDLLVAHMPGCLAKVKASTASTKPEKAEKADKKAA